MLLLFFIFAFVIIVIWAPGTQTNQCSCTNSFSSPLLEEEKKKGASFQQLHLNWPSVEGRERRGEKEKTKNEHLPGLSSRSTPNKDPKCMNLFTSPLNFGGHKKAVSGCEARQAVYLNETVVLWVCSERLVVRAAEDAQHLKIWFV